MEQFSFWQYLGYIIFFWVWVWLIAADWHYLRTGNFKWTGFEYNRYNYYILTLPFLLAVILVSLLNKTWLPLLVFAIFGTAGVIGESMFSFWWNIYFEKRFWVYRVDTAWGGYTSFLNFLPWGLGGMLFLGVVNLFSNVRTEALLMTKVASLLIFAGALIISLSIAYFMQARRKFGFELREFNLWTYMLFCLPILALLAYLAIYIDGVFGFVAVGFGLAAFVEEYLFGKIAEIFLSRKLWYYNYFTIDRDHTTVLNIIPFMLAGFYFWAIWIGIEALL